MQPAIAAPAEYATQTWTREDALVELLRARLSGLGPTTADALTASFAVSRADIAIGLAALQREGYVMQGGFTSSTADEWCQRHLLARIHRYTLGRLRREIEPVARRDFMRFAFDWQHVAADTQVSGPEALAGVLAQLEGFEAPAAAWESEILPARVADYSIGWLDDLCRAGRVVWTRLSGGAHDASKPRSAGPLRSTPIALLPRRTLSTWTSLAGHAASEIVLSSRAQVVIDALHDNGASFFDELITHTHLLRSELEDALGELVAVGAINADSFAGLRALLMPAAKRARHSQRRLRRNTLTGIEDAGRWSLMRRPPRSPTPLSARFPLPPGEGRPQDRVRVRAQRAATVSRDPAPVSTDSTETLEHIARTLLRRYGVVCWRLLEREATWLPPWRDLRRVYHRLEARGDIRGGRFVEGLVGEQFALAEAVELLRQVRKRKHDGTLVCLCGADPLNLVGTVLSGSKVPALTGSRILYRDGVAIAAWIAGKMTALIDLDPAETQLAKHALLRHAMPHTVPATLSS